MKDIDKYIEETISNINEDRDVTKSLLKDIMMCKLVPFQVLQSGLVN